MKTFEEFMVEKRDGSKASNLGGPYKSVWHDLMVMGGFSVDKLGPVTNMLSDMNDGMDEKEAWNKHSPKFNKIAGRVKTILRDNGIDF